MNAARAPASTSARSTARPAGSFTSSSATAAPSRENSSAALRPMPLPVLWVPLEVRIEPAPAFRDWLAGRLAAERARGREVPA